MRSCYEKQVCKEGMVVVVVVVVVVELAQVIQDVKFEEISVLMGGERETEKQRHRGRGRGRGGIPSYSWKWRSICKVSSVMTSTYLSEICELIFDIAVF